MTESELLTNPVRLRLIPYNARLIDARKGRGWTQKNMSLLTGISTSYLGHIETLRIIPSQQARDEICSALQLSQDYLFPPSLMESIKEGLFNQRAVELEENQVIRFSEARRAGLLPLGITQDEVIKDADRAINRELLKKKLPDILETLGPREREVIELRFGLKDGIFHTLEEVATHFINSATGLPVIRERIRQIEAKALRKLRHPSRSRLLKDFLD